MKGLEALEHIIETFYDKESEDIQIVRKELKALKVIIKKAHIRIGRNGEQYYFQTTNNYYYISKEKYDLLKEVLL